MAIIGYRYSVTRTIVLATASFVFALPHSTMHSAARSGERASATALLTTTVPEVAIHAAPHAEIADGWIVTPDSTAASGARLQNPDAGVPKLSAPATTPALAFDLTFMADAGRPYRLWLRSRALNDRYTNDSVFVQFNNSVTASGTPVWRIGSSSATIIVLENCGGCGEQGWGWADNGYGLNVLGPLVYFAQSGLQRLRIQPREDGLGIDQVVLSAVKYLSTAPGTTKNDATILAESALPPSQNAPPQVALTTPSPGTIATAPATIALQATATDSDGTIASVSFYAGSTLLGTDATSPFAMTWSAVPAGSYVLTALATDDDGASTTSGLVPVTVTPPQPGASEIVLYAAAQGQLAGGWIVTPDPTAAGGARLQNPDAGVPKVPAPAVAPALAFDLTFTAQAGRPYRLWLRGKALNDRYTNDSVFVQFDKSVTGTGVPTWRIGTTSATTVILENCSGCGEQGWGWTDNGYGALGPLVYFAQTGSQRLRIQVREDGLGIDQVVLSAATYLTNAPGAAKNDATMLAQSPIGPQGFFRLAFWNVKGGVGQVGLPGHTTTFASTSNCTDATKPLNAWGVGMVQAALTQALANDPNIVALGLAEAWGSTCGAAQNVRQVLGWKATGGIKNGLSIVARYGFAGPEQWEQLDTSLNANPADTMWVLRTPVCLDTACTRSMLVYVAHWMTTDPDKSSDESTNRQAQGTVSFMQHTSGGLPHVLIGDLNVFEGPTLVCGQRPDNTSNTYLRAAGYIDAWPTVHGTAEGYTGMTNRPGCGIPEGYAWKRIDVAWSPASFVPLDMKRFGIVPAGDGSPSDHYGIIVTYPDATSR